MARIRTIKPEFPQSESMGNVSREARLCFVLMWTIADDSGRLRADSRLLASLLYPYDGDISKQVTKWVDELSEQKCIIRYEIEGKTYIQIENWTGHQKIDRPSESKLPPFGESSRILANDTRSLVLGQEGKGKEGKGKEDQCGAFSEWKDQEGYEPLKEIWSRYESHRKTLKVTAYTPDGLKALVSKMNKNAPAGLATRLLCNCIERSLAGNWKGIPDEIIKEEADKLRTNKPPSSAPPPTLVVNPDGTVSEVA